jgi:hypothetical protein
VSWSGPAVPIDSASQFEAEESTHTVAKKGIRWPEEFDELIAQVGDQGFDLPEGSPALPRHMAWQYDGPNLDVLLEVIGQAFGP